MKKGIQKDSEYFQRTKEESWGTVWNLYKAGMVAGHTSLVYRGLFTFEKILLCRRKPLPDRATHHEPKTEPRKNVKKSCVIIALKIIISESSGKGSGK